MRLYQYILLFLLVSVTTAYAGNSQPQDKILRLATTTSTENSGLLAYLLPDFEKQTGYRVHVIAVGTGKALRMGKDGDVDVLLVHAPKAEAEFIAAGYGIQRTAVMHNDFVIVGPPHDPAHLNQANTALQAMQRISHYQQRFISRGDQSGTHKKELSLWQQANLHPQGRWYIEAGQGMGKVLQMAGEMDAYTLTDRGTWLAYQKKSPLTICFEGDPVLHNPYSVIAVNPKRYKDLNHKGAQAFTNWLVTEQTQQKIANYRLFGQPLFIPDALSSSTSQNSSGLPAL